MKFNTTVRNVLAAATSVGLGLGTVACSRDYTVAYVYATSAANGRIAGFGVDYQDGVLTQLSGSPFASSLTNPVGLVASPSGKFLYVIGGSQDDKVEEVAVGTDGKLYGEHTYSLPGSSPTAAAVDPAGKHLYVTFTYQPGETPVTGGAGGIAIYPINSDNSLGSAVTVNGLSYVGTGNNPVGIAVAAPTGGKVFVYVADQETSTAGTVLGFTQDTSTGALTAIAGSTGYRAGVTPSAIAIDPTGRFVYVTDRTSNQLIAYGIDTANTGNLTPLVSSPYSTGTLPVSVTVDPRGKYVYTANYSSGTVSGFVLNAADGSLGGVASANFTTDTGPTCVAIEDALGKYLFTSNSLAGTVSAAQLNTSTGALSAVQDTPFPASVSLPSCVAAVPNGEHANQLVYP